MNYYERHIGDYLKDTAHLSLLEHGIYGRLLDIYYSREGSIPVDQAARLVGARSDEEKAALDCVLLEFFAPVEGAWTHKRCEAEISRYQDKQRKAKASADLRWSHTERNATAMPTHSEGNAPSLQSQTPDPVEKEPTVLPAPSLRAVPVAPPAFDGSNLKAIPAKAVVPLAPNFDLPEEWGVDAEALGFPRSKVLFESERFRQFWAKGKGAQRRKSLRGWRQAWSNWLGKAAERAA